MTVEQKPTGITANRETASMEIEWDTKETFSIPFSLLRNACPCAQCRGGHEHMGPEPDEDVFSIPLTNVNTIQLKAINAVGNYAISIEWGDGHSAGIYGWDYLYILSKRMEENEQEKK
jgi:DUF971 family protein